jgi:hypothetical protein
VKAALRKCQAGLVLHGSGERDKKMKNESYIKFRNLTTGAGEPIETILQRAIGYLQGLNEKAAVELRVSGDTGKSANSTHSIVLTPCGAHLQTGIVTKPARVAIITSEAFYSVAEGSYSPVRRIWTES